jgi:hypothetical protein
MRDVNRLSCATSLQSTRVRPQPRSHTLFEAGIAMQSQQPQTRRQANLELQVNSSWNPGTQTWNIACMNTRLKQGVPPRHHGLEAFRRPIWSRGHRYWRIAWHWARVLPRSRPPRMCCGGCGQDSQCSLVCQFAPHMQLALLARLRTSVTNGCNVSTSWRAVHLGALSHGHIHTLIHIDVAACTVFQVTAQPTLPGTIHTVAAEVEAMGARSLAVQVRAAGVCVVWLCCMLCTPTALTHHVLVRAIDTGVD